MLILRPVELDDLDDLLRMSVEVGHDINAER